MSRLNPPLKTTAFDPTSSHGGLGEVPTVEPKWLSPAQVELSRLLESLSNFLYLIEHDSDEPTKIQMYVANAARCVERARIIVLQQLHGDSQN